MGDQTPKVNSNITFKRETYENLRTKAEEDGVSLSEVIDRALTEYIKTLPVPSELRVSPNLQILSLPSKPVSVEEKIDPDDIDKLFTEGWTFERQTKLLKNGSISKSNTNTESTRVDPQPQKYYRRGI